jgi:uncharacterized protein
MLRKEFYPLAAPIEDAYKDVAVVIFETDIESAENPEIQKRVQRMWSCPAGKSIADALSPETYEALQARLQELSLPPSSLDRLKPAPAGATLTAFELTRLGYEEKDGVDRHFTRRARNDGKELRFLETLTQQAAFFSDLSTTNQERFLKMTLEESKKQELFFKELIQAWLKGDDAGLNELLATDLKQYAELFEIMLSGRNKAWMKQIEPLFTERKNILVVVGAGHLCGPESVLELLKAKGVTVEQQTVRAVLPRKKAEPVSARPTK